MCCTKLNCLLAVVTTKSWRSISRSSRDSRPSAPTIVKDDLRPKGGLESTTEQRSPGSAISVSLTQAGAVGCADAVQQQVHGRQPRGASTSSTPCTNVSRRCLRSFGVSVSAYRDAYSCAASKKPPVPDAGSTTGSAGLLSDVLDGDQVFHDAHDRESVPLTVVSRRKNRLNRTARLARERDSAAPHVACQLTVTAHGVQAARPPPLGR
jgi:hypothetical protein